MPKSKKTRRTLIDHPRQRAGSETGAPFAAPCGEPLALGHESRALRPGTGRGPPPADRAPSRRAAAARQVAKVQKWVYKDSKRA